MYEEPSPQSSDKLNNHIHFGNLPYFTFDIDFFALRTKYKTLLLIIIPLSNSMHISPTRILFRNLNHPIHRAEQKCKLRLDFISSALVALTCSLIFYPLRQLFYSKFKMVSFGVSLFVLYSSYKFNCIFLYAIPGSSIIWLCPISFIIVFLLKR